MAVDTMTDRLLATCWTTAGQAAPYPGQHTSPLSLRFRIEAAGRAGFAAFGILDHDLRQFLEDGDLTTLARILSDNGMQYVELEFLTRWWTTGAERAASDEDRRLLFTAAEALGAHHVKVAPDLDDLRPPDVDFWAEAFYELACDASSHGTRVALEFMPFANVSTLDDAVAIAQRAGHPDAGLLIDLWHVQRSGVAPDAVAHVPIELILAVELDDGTREPVGDPYDDTCLRRLVPGDGEFPVVEFAAELLRLGWSLPWGVEIISETFSARDLDDSLPYVVRRSQECIARARAMFADVPD